MDQNQTVPSYDALTNNDYSPHQWLRYYRNVWTRNLISYTIDVQYDLTIKASDPETPVPFNSPVGTVEMPVKERLEHRKMNLDHAVKMLDAIAVLEGLTDQELAACWSVEALFCGNISHNVFY